MEHYIEFPALGWRIPVSPDIFTIPIGGGITVKWYGVMIALGFLLAIIYGLKRSKQFGIDPDRMIDVVLVCAIFAFIGARLYYVWFAEDRYRYFDDPLSILQVWKGGLGIYGGVIFAFLTALWMCRVRKVDTLRMFDLASIGFLIGQGIGRWGNFFNQEAFGSNTTLPWGMTGDIIQSGVNGSGYILTEPVHPTFLYESLWCLAGFLLLHILSKKWYKFRGQLFASYIIWYGLGRAWIEGLRTDSLMLGAIRISQLIAILSVIGGVILLLVFRSREHSSPKNLFAAESASPFSPAMDTEENQGGDGVQPAEETAVESPEEPDQIEEYEPAPETASDEEPGIPAAEALEAAETAESDKKDDDGSERS